MQGFRLLMIALISPVLTLESSCLFGAVGCNRRSALLSVGAAVLPPVFPALAATEKIPVWRLTGGVAFPTLALNTASLTADGTELAFRNAIAAGISHVEFHPGVERDGVARVLPSVARESVFLTTKVETGWERGPSPSAAAASVRRQIDEDLALLGESPQGLEPCARCATLAYPRSSDRGPHARVLLWRQVSTTSICSCCGRAPTAQ